MPVIGLGAVVVAVPPPPLPPADVVDGAVVGRVGGGVTGGRVGLTIPSPVMEMSAQALVSV